MRLCSPNVSPTGRLVSPVDVDYVWWILKAKALDSNGVSRHISFTHVRQVFLSVCTVTYFRLFVKTA